MTSFIQSSKLSSILNKLGYSEVEKEFTKLSNENDEIDIIPGFYSSHKAKKDNIASLLNSWSTAQSIIKVNEKYPTKDDVKALEDAYTKMNSSSSFPSLGKSISGRTLRYPQYLQLRESWKDELQPILSSRLFIQVGGNSMNVCSYDALLIHIKTISRCSEHYSFLLSLDPTRTGFILESDFKTYINHFASEFSFIQSEYDEELRKKYYEFSAQQFLVILDPLSSGKIMIGNLLNQAFFMYFVMVDGWSEDRTNPFSFDYFRNFVQDFKTMDLNNDGIIEPKDLIYMGKLRLTSAFARTAADGIGFNNNIINFEWYVRFRTAWYFLGEPFANIYFFDALDIDGNGIITQYEINYFVREVIKIAKELYPDNKSIPPYDYIASQLFDMCQASDQKITRQFFVQSRATANLVMRICDAREFIRYELDLECESLQPPIPDVHSL